MAKTVVLGDLGKYSGDTVLKFDGVDDYASIPPVTFTDLDVGSIEISCVYITTGVESYPIGKIVDFSNWIGYLSNGNIAVRFSDGTYFSVPSGIVVSGYYSIRLTFNEGIAEFFIDDASVGTQDITGKSVTINLIGEGRRISYTGDLCRVIFELSGVVVADYINNNNFGDSSLIDNSGNGNDGTIFGAVWWKKYVDEVYATPQLLKDTLTDPLGADYHVVYTDATPFYPSDDVFWNPYNLDPEFTFTVVQQGAGGADGASYTYSFSYNF